MGLTISYTLTSAATDSPAALDLVRRLHAYAKTLPFEEVGDIFVEDEAEMAASAENWHPGMRYVSDPSDRRVPEVVEGEIGDVPVEAHIIHVNESSVMEVWPIEAYWFFANMPGAEPLILGLARYPAAIERKVKSNTSISRAFETGLGEGWHWQHFTKTQYAGLPQHGGEDNFLRAHKTIVAMLDEAIRMNIHIDVSDDSQYWIHRDDGQLQQTLRQWNGLVAAVGGMLKDRVDDVQSPIFEHPAFEHLEAEGDAMLRGGGAEPPDDTDASDDVD